MSFRTLEECRDAESVGFLAADEHTKFRPKISSNFPKKEQKLLWLLVLGYIVCGGFYIQLWLQSRHLASQLRNLEPQLFPCKLQSLFPVVAATSDMKALDDSDGYRKESRVFPLTVAGSPFAGIPSPDLDSAWHDLLQGKYAHADILSQKS
jgi:hypothetical protein